jgi:hypothetical protein
MPDQLIAKGSEGFSGPGVVTFGSHSEQPGGTRQKEKIQTDLSLGL